jgi:hypothetical protein
MKDKFLRKEKAHPYWTKGNPEDDAKQAGMYANCKKRCSCWMCGNPRRKLQGKDRLTKQELMMEDVC